MGGGGVYTPRNTSIEQLRSDYVCIGNFLLSGSLLTKKALRCPDAILLKAMEPKALLQQYSQGIRRKVNRYHWKSHVCVSSGLPELLSCVCCPQRVVRLHFSVPGLGQRPCQGSPASRGHWPCWSHRWVVVDTVKDNVLSLLAFGRLHS